MVYSKVSKSKKCFSKEVIFGLVQYFSFAIVAITLVSLLWSKPFLLLVVILVVSALTLLQKKEMRELKLFIVISLGGAFAETVAIYFGTWSYALPQFIGIPLWLFPIWGLAGVFIKRLAEVF